MSFELYEAVGLFALWAIQFVVPSLRHEMLFVYGGWIVIELGLVLTGRKKLLAFPAVDKRFIHAEHWHAVAIDQDAARLIARCRRPRPYAATSGSIAVIPAAVTHVTDSESAVRP